MNKKFKLILTLITLCSVSTVKSASAYPSDDIITDASQIPSGDDLQATVDIPKIGIKDLPEEEAIRRALDGSLTLKMRGLYFDAVSAGDSDNEFYLRIFKGNDLSFGSAPVLGAIFEHPSISYQIIVPYLRKLPVQDQRMILKNALIASNNKRNWFAKYSHWNPVVRLAAQVIRSKSGNTKTDITLMRRVARSYPLPEVWNTLRHLEQQQTR
jgi:hypothetical protein